MVQGAGAHAEEPRHGPAHAAAARRRPERRVRRALAARLRRLRGRRGRQRTSERRAHPRHSRRGARALRKAAAVELSDDRAAAPGLAHAAAAATRLPAGGPRQLLAQARRRARPAGGDGGRRGPPGLARPAGFPGTRQRVDEGRAALRAARGRARVVRRSRSAGGRTPHPRTANRCRRSAPAPVASSGPEPRLALRREELTVHEFELAGVGAAGDRFVAFAYSPTGQLYAYAAGDRLADAVVRSVEADRRRARHRGRPPALSLPALSN